MHIEDESRAEFYLRHLNYYRLVAYWLPFEADHDSHMFAEGTSFERVLGLYLFDRELRLLFLDAIERIEVSVRSAWAYELAHQFGAHSHLDNALAKNQLHAQRNLDDLLQELNRSKEVFVEHYRNEYTELTPPTWAVCEVMSLGLLSRLFKNLKSGSVRSKIASRYLIEDVVLDSWLHHLTQIRNACAHHSRLWNRPMPNSAVVPRSSQHPLASQMLVGTHKLYNAHVLVLWMLDIVSPGHTWRDRFLALVLQHDIDVSYMGFPPNWRDHTIWNLDKAED